MNPDADAASSAGQQADKELIAGAIAGDPADLAQLARRFALLPRLLSAWNAQQAEPLTDEQLSTCARDSVVSLWQRVPSYTGAESFDAWLARHSAGCLELEVPAEAPGILATARASTSAPGDAEARDALALYRAEEALDRSPSTEQRPIWGVIGLLGVAAVFLTLSPMSPWQWQPSTDEPAQLEPAPPAITLVAPLGTVTEASLFQWSGPEDQIYTLVIEDAEGREFSSVSNLTEPVHKHSKPLPAGNYRWRVMTEDQESDQGSTPWADLVVSTLD